MKNQFFRGYFTTIKIDNRFNFLFVFTENLILSMVQTYFITYHNLNESLVKEHS